MWQYQWAGTGLINTRRLVYEFEYDEPQRQLGTIILPPDPSPIVNARPEQYSIDEQPVSTRVTTDGKIRVIAGVRGFGDRAAWVTERMVAVPGNRPTVVPTPPVPPTPPPAAPSLDFSDPDNSQYMPLLMGM